MSLTPQFLSQKTWDLYQTHGVPIEVSEAILEEQGLALDKELLQELIEGHQKLSQTTSAGQFKSGLGGESEKTRSLHTATHLLHQVLRESFSDKVRQMGSAITEEKARFDISLDNSELGEEKLQELEQKVQELINKKLNMVRLETDELTAREMGAIGLFGEKYGEKVSVYTLEDQNGQVYSREFCGGPHVENTAQIGKFKILKKKSIGQGLTRLEFDVQA